MRELDSVVLTRDVPNHGLAAGDVGAIVHVYPGPVYDVEFVSAGGDTAALLTLPGSHLRLSAPTDILHARPRTAPTDKAHTST